jgi:hypothetical protein
MSKQEKHALKQWRVIKPKSRRHSTLIGSIVSGLIGGGLGLYLGLARFAPDVILQYCPWDLLEAVMPLTMYIYHL